MGPSTQHLLFRQVRGNSSFIIHSKLLDFYIFFPDGALKPFYLFNRTLFKSNNSYTFVENASWEMLRLVL